MTNLHIHQIFYSDDTRRTLDPGFIPLDNLANERPDWREYWPIRKFLSFDITGLLTDSRNTMFCNYFVVTGRFWRAWFSIKEKMFAICEGPDCELKRKLN